MGGYGVVNVIGGGYSKAARPSPARRPTACSRERGAANPAYRKSVDPRIKAAIAIGPWGMQIGFWDADGLRGIHTPVLFVAGSADDVSGYEKGTRAIFEGAVNADRYLLTFVNASHNAAAPIPAPVETYVAREAPRTSPVYPLCRCGLGHRADEQHPRSLRHRLLRLAMSRATEDKRAYLDVVPNGKDAVFAVDRDGAPTAAHTYWKGFKRGTAVGLTLEHAAPGR